MNLAAASIGTFTYDSAKDNLDAGESVTVQFAADGIHFVPLQTISGNGGSTNYIHNLNGPFAVNAAIRFVTSAMNGNHESVDHRESEINFAAVETLNGGLVTTPIRSPSATEMTSSTKP